MRQGSKPGRFVLREFQRLTVKEEITVSQLKKRVSGLPALSLLSMTVLTAAGVAGPAEADTATGNIGVFSKYVLRGNTGSRDQVPPKSVANPENNNTAVQGGFDWTWDSGLFLGYWGSNLGYSYDKSNPTVNFVSNGFENDFYGGYSGKLGAMPYSIGLTQYYYINVDDSNVAELFGTLGMGPVTFGFKYLLQDAFWGNAGDTYLTATYTADLPKGFKFSGTAGHYLYDKQDSKELCGGAAGCGLTTTSSAFRHVDLTLSHPIGKTGAEAGVTYIIGGKLRTEQDLENTAVLFVKYAFDL